MQALAQQRVSCSRLHSAPSTPRGAPARVVCARASPVQRCSHHDESNQGSRFLAVSLSALLAFQLGAAPLLTPPPSQAATSEEIKERAQRKEELRRLAREKAENQKTEAIPCVTIGCSADSEEAAATRKKQAEERKEEVRRQAQIAYEQERERNERNFKGVAAKSSFTGEQESLLKERQKEAAAEKASKASGSQEEEAPVKEPPIKALQGAGIFGSSE